MKSRNKIIKELKRASGKSYKECRDFLKSISWDTEDKYLAYIAFIMGKDPDTVKNALGVSFDAIAESMRKITEVISESVKRVGETLSRIIEAIPPDILEQLRKEAENEQRDDQVSEP